MSDEDIAEMIARFRTPPGLDWKPLRDDIVTVLSAKKTRSDGTTAGQEDTSEGGSVA